MNIVEADLFNQKHAEAIMGLLNDYAEDPMGGGEALSGYTQKNLIQQLQQRADLLALIAFDGDTPTGLIISFEGFSTFRCAPLLNIHDVVVAAPFRRQGIAHMLFSYLEEIAKTRNYCKMTLEVLEGNHNAQAAYRSLGFGGYELDPATGKALFWEKKL